MSVETSKSDSRFAAFAIQFDADINFLLPDRS
jgi:hypothetical protein